MSGIPSWARVGAKVVCVRALPACADEVHPVVGGIYTIRSVDPWSGDFYLRFKEIHNPRLQYMDGFDEVEFNGEGFRPLVTHSQAQDVAKFKHLLLPTEETIDA